MFSLPSLQSLRVFEAAGRLNSFSGAADELRITPGAVSQQIKALETRLGLTLFERGGRSVAVTPDGETLLAAVRDNLGGLEATIHGLMRRGGMNEIVVSALPGFSVLWLFPRLVGFEQAHPGYRVAVNSSTSPGIYLSPDVDLAIRYGRPGEGAGREDLLFGELLFPVCAPALAQRLRGFGDVGAALAESDLLCDRVQGGPGPRPDWRYWFAETGIAGLENHRREFSQSNMAVQLAVQGMGVALGRTPLVIDALETGSLAVPFGPAIASPYAYYLSVSPGGANRQRVMAFRDWLAMEAEKMRSIGEETIGKRLAGDGASA